MKSKPNLFTRVSISLTAFVVLAMTQSTRAANIYWDGTGTSWNTAADWSTASGATTPNPSAVPGAADLAIFNISTLTAAQAITLDAAQTVLGLSFLSTSTGGVTINAGTGGVASTLTLGTSGIASASGSGAKTINSNIVLGPGAQTWTNNDNDTLTIGGTVTRNEGATLGFAGTGTVTSSTAFANDATGILGNWATFGTGTSMKYATKNGSNVIVGLTGSSAADANAFTSASANYDFTTTGTTTLTNSRTANTIHYLTGTGVTLDLGASGANTLTLNGILATGTGTLTIKRTGGTGTVVIGSSDKLVIAGSQAVTISAPVSGASKALTYSGAGTFTLSGANTYSGATTINGGTFKLGNTGALGDATNHTSGVTVNGAAIFDLAGFSPTYNAPLVLNSTASGFDVGSFYNSGGSVTYGGTVTLNANTRVGAGTIILNNTITGNGRNLNKDGLGTLQLSNSGTVSLGSLLANRGTIQVDAGTTLNVTGISIGTGNNVGAGLTLNGGAVTSSGSVTFGAGSGSASGTLTLNSGTFTVPALTKGSRTFNVNFNGGTLKANGASATFFSAATNALVKAGGAFIDDGGYAITIDRSLDHDITGLGATPDGGLEKSGAGTLTLGGVNTYTGTTTISEGTLAIGSIGSIANTSGIIVGANTTLDVSAASGFTVGGANAQILSGTGSINGNLTVGANGTLGIGSSPGTMTYSGNLTFDLGSISNFEIESFLSGNYDLALAALSGSQSVHFNGGTLNLLFQSGFNTMGTVKIFDFDAYAGTGFTTLNATGLASGYTATFDETSGIVTVVPETSAMAMLGSFGLLAMLRRRCVG